MTSAIAAMTRYSLDAGASDGARGSYGPSCAAGERGGTRGGFRLQKDFHYQAKFPCSLAEAPALTEGRFDARSKAQGRTTTHGRPPQAAGKTN